MKIFGDLGLLTGVWVKPKPFNFKLRGYFDTQKMELNIID